MKTAKWNGVVIAQADQYQEVEGNVYFPLSSLKMEYFEKSSKTSVCSWKGTCGYYNIKVNGQVNQDAGWCYESPKPAASNIKNHVAFWKGVSVQ